MSATLFFQARGHEAGQREYESVVEKPLRSLKHLRVETLAHVGSATRRFALYLAHSGSPETNLPSILVSAGVHGDEPAGVFAAIRFLQEIAPCYTGQFRFVVLPCVNPTGFAADTLETSSGANLNRLFGTGATEPEVRAIEERLHAQCSRYLATFDLHETRPDYQGEGFVESDNPRGCYLYETTLERDRRIGRELIDSLPAGTEVCAWPQIYLDDNTDGVVYYPEACHNPIYKQGTSLDGYLNGRYTSHSFTTETPTGWDLGKRVDTQLRWLNRALQLLK